MCVYSVSAKDTREFGAQKGERLGIVQFEHAKGFAESGKRESAVCMCEGTVVDIVEPARYAFLNALTTARATLVEGDRTESYPSMGRRKQDELVFDGNVRFRLDELPVSLTVEVVSVPVQAGEEQMEEVAAQQVVEVRVSAQARQLAAVGV